MGETGVSQVYASQRIEMTCVFTTSDFAMLIMSPLLYSRSVIFVFFYLLALLMHSPPCHADFFVPLPFIIHACIFL